MLDICLMFTANYLFSAGNLGFKKDKEKKYSERERNTKIERYQQKERERDQDSLFVNRCSYFGKKER